MNYIIVREIDISSLEFAVNEKIKEKYFPVGGMIETEHWYIQTMIKIEYMIRPS